MDNKRKVFLTGFLLVNSIHWGSVVLTALLENIVGMFIDYNQLPWFRLVILIIEILFIIRFLEKKLNNIEINEQSFLRLIAFSVILFISAQFYHLYDYSPGFCGNALLDGSLDDFFHSRSENLSYVHIIETILISISIIYYALKEIKKRT